MQMQYVTFWYGSNKCSSCREILMEARKFCKEVLCLLFYWMMGTRVFVGTLYGQLVYLLTSYCKISWGWVSSSSYADTFVKIPLLLPGYFYFSLHIMRLCSLLWHLECYIWISVLSTIIKVFYCRCDNLWNSLSCRVLLSLGKFMLAVYLIFCLLIFY